MKRVTCLILLQVFYSVLSFAQAYHISHYNLNLELFPSEKQITCKAQLVIVSDSSSMPPSITLELAYDTIKAVTTIAGEKVNFKTLSHQLIVESPYNSDTLCLEIDYQTTFYGMTSNHISTGNSYLLFESEYYPQVKDAFLRGDRSTFEMDVVVPDTLIAVVNADLKGVDNFKRKRIYSFASTNPNSSITLSVAEYKIIHRTINATRVTFYIYPEHAYAIDSLSSRFLSVLEFYQKKFGEYPEQDFKIVETDRRGGYGPYGMMLLNKNDIMDMDLFTTFLVAHEMAHTWFPGITLINDDSLTFNINESFAQYFAFSYLDYYGLTDSNYQMYKMPLIDKPIEGSVYEMFRLRYHLIYEDNTLANIPDKYSKAAGWAGYYKGSFLLRALAMNVGTDRYNNFLAGYLKKHKFKAASFYNFIDAYNKCFDCDAGEIMHNIFYTDNILDYEISDLESHQLQNGKFENVITVKNCWDFSIPNQIKCKTKSGREFLNTIESVDDLDKITIELDEEIISAEIDPCWYILDANRVNNFYPRKYNFDFLIDSPSYTANQVFFYPSISYGLEDRLRLGVWATNVFTFFPSAFEKKPQSIQMACGIFIWCTKKPPRILC